MAEFQEVIKQGQRMCNHYDVCDECPVYGIYRIDGRCIIHQCSQDGVELENLEAEVMKWAAAHPEPQYPSWAEWKITNFQNCICNIHLCNFAKCPFCGPSLQKCEKCESTPIPAYIAKKLGIKPKEEKQ